MGGYIHTGVGDGTARSHYASIGQLQDGEINYGVTGGSANAQTLTLSPAITAYQAGQIFRFKAGYTNTSTATLNVNGLGAKQLRYWGFQISGYEIQANQIYCVQYDGTYFELINPTLAQYCLAYRATAQAISQNTWTAITFDQEHAESLGTSIHSVSADTHKFNVPKNGIYLCEAKIEADGGTTDERYLAIRVDGTIETRVGVFSKSGAGQYPAVYGGICSVLALTVGSYVDFAFVNHTNGENIDSARGSIVLLHAVS